MTLLAILQVDEYSSVVIRRGFVHCWLSGCVPVATGERD